MSWTEAARACIREAHLSLPPNATLKEREKKLREAYPFGERRGWPYKAWLAARKAYLDKYRHGDPAILLQSPLWRSASKRENGA